MSVTVLSTVLAQNAGGNWSSALMIAGVLLGLVGFVVWLWALSDAIRNPALDGTARLLWIFGIVLTGIVGVVLYVLIGRRATTRPTAGC